MRRDIQVNTTTGDIKLVDRNDEAFYSFDWYNGDANYLYGQIRIPLSYPLDDLKSKGICVKIPYTTIYKKIKVSVNIDYGGTLKPAISCLSTVSNDFPIKSNGEDIMASELMLLGGNTYTIIFGDNTADIYSSKLSDLNNIVANIQNRNLLLRCVPSNNYRYPTSGVGLIRYLHASSALEGLADRLEEEFNNDNVDVNSASFDTTSGELLLDLDFTKADGEV